MMISYSLFGQGQLVNMRLEGRFNGDFSSIKF